MKNLKIKEKEEEKLDHIKIRVDKYSFYLHQHQDFCSAEPLTFLAWNSGCAFIGAARESENSE
jgi:hypothetical protein